MKLLFALPLLLFLPALTAPETLSGRVVNVVKGGESVYVLDAAQEQHKIRLAGKGGFHQCLPVGSPTGCQ